MVLGLASLDAPIEWRADSPGRAIGLDLALHSAFCNKAGKSSVSDDFLPK
jgi:hypothetical protein